MNIAKYQYKDNIDLVVDMLYEKPLTIVEKIKDLTVINEDGINLKSFEIFNKTNNLLHANLFKGESEILSKIPEINRALYTILEPQSLIPDHVDEEDFSYRIVTGVISSNGVTVEAQETTAFLKNKFSIGLDASNVLHNARNFTDRRCSMLIICLDKNPFLTNNFIEIV